MSGRAGPGGQREAEGEDSEVSEEKKKGGGGGAVKRRQRLIFSSHPLSAVFFQSRKQKQSLLLKLAGVC